MASRKAKTNPSALSAIAAVLARRGTIAISQGKASAELTPEVSSALRELVYHLLRGDGAAVVPRRAEMTTQEAADILGFSRQHLVRLVDAGELPVRTTTAGRHRRLAAVDVLELKKKRDADKAHAQEIADMFEEFAKSRATRSGKSI